MLPGGRPRQGQPVRSREKRWRGFDVAFQTSIDERQIRELATLRFVAQAENLLLLGPPGTGKTHRAIALGMLTITRGVSVSFLTVADLLDTLHRDAKGDRLGHRLQAFCRPKLFILDEMGYFPLDRLAAQFLFQLISRRYQKTSLIITSHKGYGDWGEIFADQVLASAILDRVLHHSTTIDIRGPGLSPARETAGRGLPRSDTAGKGGVSERSKDRSIEHLSEEFRSATSGMSTRMGRYARSSSGRM